MLSENFFNPVMEILIQYVTFTFIFLLFVSIFHISTNLRNCNIGKQGVMYQQGINTI